MATDQPSIAQADALARSRGPRRGFWQSPPFNNRLALLSGAVLLLVVLMAAAAPLVATHDPNAQDLAASLAPPSAAHWLGADKQGRDTWSRIVYGARPALLGALGVVLISELIGVPLGLAAGYFGGRVDTIIMRALDMLLAFPALLLAILIVATFGRSLSNAVIALGIVYIPTIARVVRGVTLVQGQQAYVEAARAVGYGHGRVLFGHLLPNVAAPILVQSSIDLAYAILDIAALSFLGLGVQPPTADWGSMLADGRSYLLLSPYVALSAGASIMLVVIAFNLFGDGLRSGLDPRRGER